VAEKVSDDNEPQISVEVMSGIFSEVLEYIEKFIFLCSGIDKGMYIH